MLHDFGKHKMIKVIITSCLQGNGSSVYLSSCKHLIRSSISDLLSCSCGNVDTGFSEGVCAGSPDFARALPGEGTRCQTIRLGNQTNTGKAYK